MSDTPEPGARTVADTAEEYERTFDPTAQEERDAAEKEALRLALERKKLLTAMLQNIEIREWIWELLVEWNTFNTQFGDHTAGDAAGQVSFYWRGLHDAGWRLWTQLDDAAPELTSLMRREHNAGSTLV